VVILAGYEDRMDEFFGSNPGMSSRIAHHLDFAAYERALRHYLTGEMARPRFANARSVRNELERARLAHAHRLASDLHRQWTRDDLMRLEPNDILTTWRVPEIVSPAADLGFLHPD
jgi:hypothetical protein